MTSSTRLKNVHVGVVPPGSSQHISLVKGDFEYWHYCCDGMDDRGWGCGYRTLQTVCSWIRLQQVQSQQSPTQCEPSNNSQLGSFSLQNSSGLKNNTNSNVTHRAMNKRVDVRNNDVISVIGSGDINSGDVISDDVSNVGGASAVRCEAKIALVAYGNGDITQGKTVTQTSNVSEEDADGIMVLSSGNTISLESETQQFALATQIQNTCDKKHDNSNITVLSSGDRNKSQGLVLPSSVEESVKKSDQPHSNTDSKTAQAVPSLPEIQNALVQMGDKPGHFFESRQWIGSYEVCLCLDFFYEVPCKIVHISRGTELKQHLSTLKVHFSTLGSPVMMGGDSDASSKGIVGVCMDPGALLVVDPHYSGKKQSAASLQASGWVKWVLLDDFHPTSFYNLCLPQLAARAPS